MNSEQIWSPTLVGDRVQIRPMVSEDFEALYQVACDPEIWRLHSEPTRYQKPAFKIFFDKAIQSRGALVVEDRHSKTVLGGTRFYDYLPDQRSVVIGYTFLARACWGGTVNRELKGLMLDYAFQYVDTVLFHASVGNLRSLGALQKLGATKRPELVNLPGVGIRVEFFITRESWNTLRQKNE